MTRNYLQLFNTFLQCRFQTLGSAIGKNPVQFMVITILTTFLLGTGVQRFTFVNNVEQLFSPYTGASKGERQIVEQFFPLNYSGRFEPSRLVETGRITRVYLKARDGGTLLRTSVWREMEQVNELIRNITIVDSEQEFKFDDMCARWQDSCFHWNILDLGEQIEGIEAGNVTVNYPFSFNPVTFDPIVFPVFTGGVKVSNVSTVESVKALQLLYALDHQSPLKNLRAQKWEGAVIAELEKLDKDWEFVEVEPITLDTLSSEVDRNNFSAIPYMLVTVPLMVLFASLTCMSSDWVRSKPWLGIAGIICPLLGCVGAFGLLCYFEIPLCSTHIATPFLMLGIGIDDSFVMIAAWRQTKVTDPVPKRLGDAFAEAGVSITITSLTDMLSFWVGMATPIFSIQIFSAYSGTAVLGTYLCHLFVFGGALALSGYHEADNRHALFFWRQATPKSKMNPKESWFHRKFWVGGIDPVDPHNPLNRHESSIMNFFRDKWAFYLNKPKVKALVLILFVIYLAISSYGVSLTKEGLDQRKLARDESYAGRFLDTDTAYFRDFPYRIHVVITGDVEYSNKSVQDKIETMMQQFESSKYIARGAPLTESWLRGFVRIVEKFKAVDLEFNVSSEVDFIQTLRENYLNPELIISDDVKFNDNYTKIIASRFLIQAINVWQAQDEIDMVNELRAIAHAQSPGLNVTVFNWYFNLLDGHLLIRSLTIQCVTVAGLIMMVVSIIFIPNLTCSLWVAFSIISTEVGVLGFLAFWNVNLDGISMMHLIMCIGFSVDFSAHISYAYLTAKADTPEERVKSCLYVLGWPIFQGAASTILGVLSLIFVPSYFHRTFFKSVVLVMTIAAVHGLILLPVLLSIFGPGSQWQNILSGKRKKVTRRGENFNSFKDGPTITRF